MRPCPFSAVWALSQSGAYGNGIGLVTLDGAANIVTNRVLVAATASVRDWCKAGSYIYLVLEDDTILSCDLNLAVVASRKIDAASHPNAKPSGIGQDSQGNVFVAYRDGSSFGIFGVNSSLDRVAGTDLLVTGFSSAAVTGGGPSAKVFAQDQWVVGNAAGGFRSAVSAQLAKLVYGVVSPLQNHPGIRIASANIGLVGAPGGTSYAGPMSMVGTGFTAQAATTWTPIVTPQSYGVVMSEV